MTSDASSSGWPPRTSPPDKAPLTIAKIDRQARSTGIGDYQIDVAIAIEICCLYPRRPFTNRVRVVIKNPTLTITQQDSDLSLC